MLVMRTRTPTKRKAWCPRRAIAVVMTIVVGSAILKLDTFVSITRVAIGQKIYNKEVKK
jgi:hypothetical protein